MYTPRPFEIADKRAMHEIIAANPFGILVSSGGALVATHLPFLLHTDEGDNGTLYAHMARPNQHRTVFGSEALAIFMGPHGYVSPNWYSDSTTNVPTWNYLAVHAYGVPQELPEDESAPHLARLVAAFEPPGGWSMKTLKPSLADTMPKGVAAFRIEIKRLEGKAKLSQNKPVAERVRVMDSFRECGETAIADEMQKDLESTV